VELVAGSGGVFKVSLENNEIFSKYKAKRFPAAAEILAKLA
jgi:predicted Rdx family selenoprotein